MSTRIERILFFFFDGRDRHNELNNRFFPLALLFNRLINSQYNGPKIKFININFRSQKSFDLYPNNRPESFNLYRGHLNYDGLFDFDKFERPDKEEQISFIWTEVCDVLAKVAEEIGNNELKKALEYVKEAGIKNKFEVNYKVLEEELLVFDKPVNTSLWFDFSDAIVRSMLRLCIGQDLVWEREVHRSEIDLEFFLVMYKKILYLGEGIILIKGHYAYKGLPAKFKIEKEDLLK
uniref:hypothetical protein n=1 Tax=Roseivirga sp. TaxID=1964215 RepID=UPI0040483AFE